MKHTRKETKALIQAYVLSCIDSEGYSIVTTTDKEKINFLFDTFKKEYGFNIPRMGQQKAFVEWCMGLPSCFNVAFSYVDIIALGNSWGYDLSKTAKEDLFCTNYWNMLYMAVTALLRKPEPKPVKVKKVKEPKKDKLQKLAESLDFRTVDEYFNYCIDSYDNGNFNQCTKLFRGLTKAGRKELINFISGCYDNCTDRPVYKFYFNLL